MSNKKAFTLIELIVVVFIIAIISSLVMISLSVSRQRSYDAKRITDITQLQIALESYYSVEGEYPQSLEFGESLIGSSTGIVFLSEIPTNASQFNSNCPSGGYEYYYYEDFYNISFCLDKGADIYSSGMKCASSAGILNEECVRLCDYLELSNCGLDCIYYDKVYSTVKIGDQCWFGKNLDVGSRINSCIAGPCIVGSNCNQTCVNRGTSANNQSNNSIIEKYCYNDLDSNCDIYGGLYQWNEIMNYTTSTSQGICPTGWRIPNDLSTSSGDFYNLISYAGGSSAAGGRLKQIGTTYWNSPNLGATDEFGFSSLPSGYYNSNGSFDLINQWNLLWSSSDFTGSNPFYSVLSNGLTSISRNNSCGPNCGLSLRCFKD